VQAPVSTNRYQSYANMEEFNQLMQTYGTYLNFNEPTQFIDTLHFYDNHHLNQSGVEKMNVMFLEWLITNDTI
jgi:hypothetical protein